MVVQSDLVSTLRDKDRKRMRERKGLDNTRIPLSDFQATDIIRHGASGLTRITSIFLCFSCDLIYILPYAEKDCMEFGGKVESLIWFHP